MTQDRYGVMIRGKRVQHSTAARDWYCRCGYKIVTKYFEEAPHWRSVCASGNEGHDPDQWIHTGSLGYVEWQRMVESLTAQEVFEHLPKEVQEAITKGEMNGY